MSKSELDVLKAGVEGATAGALQPFHELISKLAGPATEEMGLTWRDHVRVWRLSRALRLAKQVNELLEANGPPTKPIQLKVLLPSLEHASLEDDDYLQDQWAALLANAANPRHQQTMLPVFVEILKQLSANDARFLEKAYEEAHSFSYDGNEIGDRSRLLSLYGEAFPDGEDAEFKIAFENLFRLGLLTVRRRERTGHDSILGFSSDEDGETTIIENRYEFTKLGLSFVSSCRPTKDDEEYPEVT